VLLAPTGLQHRVSAGWRADTEKKGEVLYNPGPCTGKLVSWQALIWHQLMLRTPCLARRLAEGTCVSQHVCALLHLSGQGPAKTRLVFPKSLAAVLGSSTTYTYGPAFIQFNGANWLNAQTFLATVTAVRGPSALA